MIVTATVFGVVIRICKWRICAATMSDEHLDDPSSDVLGAQVPEIYMTRSSMPCQQYKLAGLQRRKELVSLWSSIFVKAWFVHGPPVVHGVLEVGWAKWMDVDHGLWPGKGQHLLG